MCFTVYQSYLRNICERRYFDLCVCMLYIMVSKLIGFPLSSCSFFFVRYEFAPAWRTVRRSDKKRRTPLLWISRDFWMNAFLEACFLFDIVRRCQRGRHLVAKSVRVWEIIIRMGSSSQGRAYTLETGCGYSRCMHLLHSL